MMLALVVNAPDASAQAAVTAAAADGSPASRQEAAARYQWQYRYTGRHARLEGYWAPVK